MERVYFTPETSGLLVAFRRLFFSSAVNQETVSLLAFFSIFCKSSSRGSSLFLSFIAAVVRHCVRCSFHLQARVESWFLQ